MEWWLVSLAEFLRKVIVTLKCLFIQHNARTEECTCLDFIKGGSYHCWQISEVLHKHRTSLVRTSKQFLWYQLGPNIWQMCSLLVLATRIWDSYNNIRVEFFSVMLCQKTLCDSFKRGQYFKKKSWFKYHIFEPC